MKRMTKIALFAVGLMVLVALTGVVPGLRPLTEFPAVVQAADDDVLTFDAAADCRTFAGGPNRGDAIIINGKIFPAGTLPSGPATNDPTQPVNGVAPIGDWINRGQNGVPFPPAIAPSYSSAPASFGTDYFILDDGRALTTEGYLVPPGVVLSSVTGWHRRLQECGWLQPGHHSRHKCHRMSERPHQIPSSTPLLVCAGQMVWA